MPLPKIKPFLTGALFGVCVSFVAWRYHVVRYADGVMLVPRTHQPPVRSAYVDIREWGAAMWKQYPEVAEALVSDGHSKLIAEQVAASLQLQLEDEVGELQADSDLKTRATSLLKSAAGDAKERLIPIRFKAADETELQPIAPVQDTSAAPRADAASAAASRPVSQTPPPSESLKSALDALFAPYSEQAGAADGAAPKTLPPREEPNRSVAEPRENVSSTAPSRAIQELDAAAVRPVSNTAVAPAAPSEPLMELESLDIELGEPADFQPAGQVLPRRAGSAFKLSPTPPGSGVTAAVQFNSL